MLLNTSDVEVQARCEIQWLNAGSMFIGFRKMRVCQVCTCNCSKTDWQMVSPSLYNLFTCLHSHFCSLEKFTQKTLTLLPGFPAVPKRCLIRCQDSFSVKGYISNQWSVCGWTGGWIYFHSIHRRTKWGYDTWHPETLQLHQRTIKPFDPKKNTSWLPRPTLRLGGRGASCKS